MTQPRVTTPLPILSRQARLEGHSKSLELRRQRSVLKLGLSRSLPHPMIRTGALVAAFSLDFAQGMKVRTLLMALPYIGPTKARAMLDAAGIPWNNTVKACGPKQRERLFALLQKR